MLKFLLAFLLFVFVLVLMVLKRAYLELPTLELKRQARAKNTKAHRLYRAAVYEQELSLLLWSLVGLAAAGVLVLAIRSMSAWVAYLVVVGLIWYSIIWLTFVTVPSVAKHAAAWIAPFLAWLLDKLHPILGRLTRLLDHYTGGSPSRLYQTEDLLDLINRQSEEKDNRIPKERLEMASRALTFGDIYVRDIMVPRRVMVTVDSRDETGPVLMGELHDSGHSRFPVYEGQANNFVGTLYLKDMIDIKKGGSVKSVMKKEVYYVHEEYTLNKVLHAFLKTKHHLFIVVDKAEEVVGVVTIEDVLEQIIGEQIVDEFDKYEDLRAVAEDKAKQIHDKQTEVIE